MPIWHRLSEKAKPISLDERQRMIAEAAYYLSEKRGFQGTDQNQLVDWLTAEKEIEKMLVGCLVGGLSGFFDR